MFVPLKILCFVKKKRDNLHLILNTSAQHDVQITLGEMKYLREVKNSEKKVGRSKQFSNGTEATFACNLFVSLQRLLRLQQALNFTAKACIVSIFETSRVYTGYIVKFTPRHHVMTSFVFGTVD